MKGLTAGLIFFTAVCFGQDKAKEDTVIISAKYGIDVTTIPGVPKFITGIIGGVVQFFRFAPSKLVYRETIFASSEDDGFRMELKDQSDKEWIHAISDMSETSFAEPPESKRDTLNSDGIMFITGLRNFFRNPDTLFFGASFRFGSDTLTFSVFRDTSAKIDAEYREYKPALYRFLSSDQNGKPYLKCEFLVGLKDGIVVYPRVDAYLFEKRIGLSIYIRQLEVIKK